MVFEQSKSSTDILWLVATLKNNNNIIKVLISLTLTLNETLSRMNLGMGAGKPVVYCGLVKYFRPGLS